MEKDLVLRGEVADRFDENRLESERNAGTIDFTENVESMRIITGNCIDIQK